MIQLRHGEMAGWVTWVCSAFDGLVDAMRLVVSTHMRDDKRRNSSEATKTVIA